MNVAFCNRDASTVQGGDTNKITQYISHMGPKGVGCGYATKVTGDFSGYDIMHVFHLGHDFSYKFHLEAKRLGKPVVLSPIYFPSQSNPLGYRKEMVKYASAILYLSEGEKDAVESDTGIDTSDKAYIVPNGINPVFGEPGPHLVHPNCKEEDYVLCVGRLQPRKNQARLAQACRELDIPLMLIGDPYDKNEVDPVQGIASEWEGLWHFPAMDHEGLASAYRGAKVLACPSTHEIWPNVVAEGGLAGCNLVVSNKSMSFTDVDGVFTCGTNKDSIRDAVEEAYTTQKNGKLKQYFSQFTWDKTVDDIIDVYKKTIGHWPSCCPDKVERHTVKR